MQIDEIKRRIRGVSTFWKRVLGLAKAILRQFNFSKTAFVAAYLQVHIIWYALNQVIIGTRLVIRKRTRRCSRFLTSQIFTYHVFHSGNTASSTHLVLSVIFAHVFSVHNFSKFVNRLKLEHLLGVQLFFESCFHASQIRFSFLERFKFCKQRNGHAAKLKNVGKGFCGNTSAVC